MKLSIIIPCYNCENYLEDCIKSIINQSYKLDYEILLINDGSSDRTKTIIEDYNNQYSIIRTFHQSNSGPSIARNNGLLNSLGEWIWFIDADDIIVNNCFEILYPILTISEIEAIQFKENIFKTFNEISSNTVSFPITSYGNKVYKGKDILNKRLNTYVPHDIIIKKSLLLSTGLQFTPYILHEDFEFKAKIYYYLHKILLLDKILYYKRVTPSSITSTLNFKKNFDILTVAQRLYEFRNFVSEDMKCNYDYLISLAINNSMYLATEMPKDKYKKFRKDFRKSINLYKCFLNSKKINYLIEGIFLIILKDRFISIYNFIKQISKY